MSEKTVVTSVEKPHSIEIKKSAKGEISWNVKCYGGTLKEALEESKLIVEELNEEYGE